MTPHNHSKFVPGCYRCELSRDEATADLIEQVEERRRDPEFMARLDKIVRENRDVLDALGGE